VRQPQPPLTEQGQDAVDVPLRVHHEGNLAVVHQVAAVAQCGRLERDHGDGIVLRHACLPARVRRGHRTALDGFAGLAGVDLGCLYRDHRGLLLAVVQAADTPGGILTVNTIPRGYSSQAPRFVTRPRHGRSGMLSRAQGLYPQGYREISRQP
jgi:hypothetical protein